MLNCLQKDERAMTLVDMLVAMAIFGVLVAALFTVFIQVKNSIATSGASKQLQAALMTSRRDAINTVLPKKLEGDSQGLGNASLKSYTIVIDAGDDVDNFSRKVEYLDLTQTNEFDRKKNLPVVQNMKKSQYSNVDIRLESCGTISETGTLTVQFDAITGNFTLNPNNPIESCDVEFTVNSSSSSQVVRVIKINSKERSIIMEQ